MRSSSKQTDDVYSDLLVEWGQYIDHDLTLTPQSKSSASIWSGPDCLNTCQNVHPCFPIETGDTITGVQSCMPFFRSRPACFINFGSDIQQALQRQQMNVVTSFIDASSVYGHTPKLESSLRDLSGLNGKLAVNDQFRDPKGRPYLPFIAPQPHPVPSACQQGPHGERVECFSAGDSRVNEGLPLICLHVLWLREHNRIAEALKHINGHWSPETIYQETRKIIGALHQIITMRDYVPKIIGQEAFEHYIGPYRGYDPTTDPSASNVFATAAFRFGHATISPILMRLNESFQRHEHYPHLRISNSLFSPWRIVKEGGIEPVLRGAFGSAAVAVSADMLLTEELTESLLIFNVTQHMDLAALNLQRGRDHALPGYNAWRSFCGLRRITTLDDFKKVVRDYRVTERIAQIYKHPDNIDVWLGGLVESMLPGSRTGPLFACLIGKQMKALRDGDSTSSNLVSPSHPSPTPHTSSGSHATCPPLTLDSNSPPPQPYRGPAGDSAGTIPLHPLHCRLVDLITDGDDREYRDLNQEFVDWCLRNHLQINAGKTKELMMDSTMVSTELKKSGY
ncbi:hypothetical protein ABVT39_004145 [Epinephelus coioides]